MDKIKTVLGAVGSFLVALLLGALYFVIQKNKKLELESIETKEEGKLTELKHDQIKSDISAADAISNYDKLRDSFLAGSDPVVRPSNTSTEGSDSGKG